MRSFFNNCISFQNHFVSNNGVTKISSAGPVWQVEIKGPNFAQPIKDSILHWVQQAQMDVAVIRGKSNIAELRERVCVGTSEAIAFTFNIPKGKGKGKGTPQRITICWPDARNEDSWRIIADGLVVLKGKTDLVNMCYEITFSLAAINNQEQSLGHSIREWELHDRTGYMLPVVIKTEEDLSQCDRGRQPKGLGKGNGGGGVQLGQSGAQQSGGGVQLGQGGAQQSGGPIGARLGDFMPGPPGAAQTHASGAMLGQQQGGGAQLGQQQSGADAWQGQKLGPTPGTVPASEGGTPWSSYSKAQLLGSATLGGSSHSGGPQQGGGAQAHASGAMLGAPVATYANTPVTAIGNTSTVTNPDGTPFVQPVAS